MLMIASAFLTFLCKIQDSVPCFNKNIIVQNSWENLPNLTSGGGKTDL